MTRQGHVWGQCHRRDSLWRSRTIRRKTSYWRGKSYPTTCSIWLLRTSSMKDMSRRKSGMLWSQVIRESNLWNITRKHIIFSFFFDLIAGNPWNITRKHENTKTHYFFFSFLSSLGIVAAPGVIWDSVYGISPSIFHFSTMTIFLNPNHFCCDDCPYFPPRLFFFKECVRSVWSE